MFLESDSLNTVQGWVLTTPDLGSWEDSLKNFDILSELDKGVFERNIVEVELLSDVLEGQKQFGPPGSRMTAWVYH